MTDNGCSWAAPRDWAQPVEIACRCADCRLLEAFARDPARDVGRFPMAEARRRHLEEQIRKLEVDLQRTTERRGSPHTLVCTKTWGRFERARRQHAKDLLHLATLRHLADADPRVADESAPIEAAVTRHPGQPTARRGVSAQRSPVASSARPKSAHVANAGRSG